MSKWNFAKRFLFWLFKIFVLPAIQAKIEEKIVKLTDELIKSRYNATTIDDIDDIKFHTRNAFKEFSEKWLDE